MKIWTVQPVAWYENLLKNGTISGERKYIDEDWKFCLFGYHWLMGKMDERIGRRPFPECYPIWGWYQYLGHKRRKPDLRSTGFLPKGTKGVRVEIEKDEKDVLLSDFMLWSLLFGYWSFIGRNEEESVAFDDMLEAKGLDRKNLGKLPKNIRREIIKSWDRVLDMDFDDPYHTSPIETKAIQATFWTLSLHEIISVDEFTAR